MAGVVQYDEEQVAGSITDMSAEEARRAQVTDQSRLTDFSSESTTYLGCVLSVDDGIEDVIDENEERLSPPYPIFDQWLTRRKEIDAEKTTAHNQAFDEVNYAVRFRGYLQKNDDAESALIETALRVLEGKHIVLVCYCSEGRKCHRKQVLTHVKRWVEICMETDGVGEGESTELSSLDDFT